MQTFPKPSGNSRWPPHIAATAGVLGGDFALLVLGVGGVLGANPGIVYPAAYAIGAWLVAPLAVLSLGTGLLLAWETAWEILRYWWVVIKLAITATLNVLALLVLVPRLEAAAKAAAGPASGMQEVAERMPLAIAPAVSAILLLLAVGLAVFKPDWRFTRRTS